MFVDHLRSKLTTVVWDRQCIWTMYSYIKPCHSNQCQWQPNDQQQWQSALDEVHQSATAADRTDLFEVFKRQQRNVDASVSIVVQRRSSVAKEPPNKEQETPQKSRTTTGGGSHHGCHGRFVLFRSNPLLRSPTLDQTGRLGHRVCPSHASTNQTRRRRLGVHWCTETKESAAKTPTRQTRTASTQQTQQQKQQEQQEQQERQQRQQNRLRGGKRKQGNQAETQDKTKHGRVALPHCGDDDGPGGVCSRVRHRWCVVCG